MKVNVYIKRPDEEYGHSTCISTSLKNLQNTVGGYIEPVYFSDLIILCNEEGRLMNLPYNCTIRGIPFVGTIIGIGVSKEDEEEFTDVPISFQEWKELIKKGG